MNDYSLRCLTALTEAFPQFKNYVTTTPDSDYLTIELESPSGALFWVTTEGKEITVGFAQHHQHFGCPGQPDAQQDAEDAMVAPVRSAEGIAHIQSLLNGETAIAVWTRDGELVMSSTLTNDDDPTSPPLLGGWFLEGSSVELKRW